jgi:hypothetical protein
MRRKIASHWPENEKDSLQQASGAFSTSNGLTTDDVNVGGLLLAPVRNLSTVRSFLSQRSALISRRFGMSFVWMRRFLRNPMIVGARKNKKKARNAPTAAPTEALLKKLLKEAIGEA